LPTVVVLGAGLLYAGRLKGLLKYEGVSLVTELLPWVKPERYTFARRNRIIAGLSEKLFVVEAGPSSGALITARYALSYGRPVLVFTGEGERFEGCRRLLNEGARPVEGTVQFGLLELLKKPRTLDELATLTNRKTPELLLELTRLMAEGKVKREGAYYCRL
ncbi:MAG: DNA-protecting protein DprA, partial [Aquificae bacterium]|nr:DNA-protecting protein DprA [Aquificota bacterium]